jgi:hypothetical protein
MTTIKDTWTTSGSDLFQVYCYSGHLNTFPTPGSLYVNEELMWLTQSNPKTLQR